MKVFGQMRSRLRLAQLGRIGALVTIASALSLPARENEIEHQEIERSVRLTPTPAAPSNAVGIAELEIGHRSASRSNRIEIHTGGLGAGIYNVTVFDRSGTPSAILGSFLAGGGDDDSCDDSGHHQERRDRDGSEDAKRRGGDDDDEGEAKFAAPESINVLNLGLIVITDGSGTEILVGDFSEITNTVIGRISSRVTAEHGVGDDDASGAANISGRIRRGRGNGQFTLTGRNLPPSSTLTLVINGEDKSEVRTDRRGRLRVRRSQQSLDVFSVLNVSVRDDSGSELLKAQF